MKPAATLGLFAAGLALTFGISAAVGNAVGPIDVAGADHRDVADDAGHGASGHDASPTDDPGPALSGLAIAADGYRLVADSGEVAAGATTPYTFRIEGPDGHPQVAYDERHERLLHLIVVSRNLVDFSHLHPDLDADGTWRVTLPALDAGSYRVYADFQPRGGEPLTLATDLAVPGSVAAVTAPAARDVDEIDGYLVRRTGEVAVGASTLSFEVFVDGAAVATEPYLGAAGHLVVIRAGDLGYLHVHPLDADDGSPAVSFAADFPSAGTYRLFLDFAHAGEVHTASFTVDVDVDVVDVVDLQAAGDRGEGHP